MKTKLLAAAAAISMAMAAAAPAGATVWQLNLTASQSGVTPYGTVEVTESAPNTLSFLVTLRDDLGFVDTGDHNAFTFALMDAPTVTFNGVPSGFGTVQSSNNVNNSPFQAFDYGLTCTNSVGSCKQSTGGFAGPLSFSVTATGLNLSKLAFATEQFNGQNVLFAADTINANGLTAAVGGGPCVSGCGGGGGQGVPEPSAWALMIAGFGGVGALMRRRRMAFASF